MNFYAKMKKGFTLIELLVVISIIALLLSILLPSLQTVKELASGVVCIANEKNLATAWVLYYEENDSKIVGGSTYNSGNRATPYRWVEPPLIDPVYDGTRSSLAPPEPTLEHRLNGIRAGKLFKYVENVDLYHCKGDKTMVKNESPYDVYRSYSITGLMNGEHFRNRAGGIFTPITDLYTFNGKPLKMAIKITDVVSPATKLVFVEENVVSKKSPQEYPKGGWVLLGGGLLRWWDAPADFHNGASTFAFADGHASKRKWQDKDTITMIESATADVFIDDPDPENNEDLIWLAEGYIPKK